MFKSQLTKTQRDDMKINNDFEKRRDRLAQSHHGYKNKIKSIPDFEIEEYDCGEEPLEVLVKLLSNMSYNVLKMCMEMFNGTPGNDRKDKIKRITAKLLLEYGENSKELTTQMNMMIKELPKHGIDTKLPRDFMTTMINVISLIDQKRDEETDTFLTEQDEEAEFMKQQETLTQQRRQLLGLKKKNLTKETKDTERRTILDYNSSDSEDTMRSKVPLTLEIDHNNITKLKQRILVWAASQPDYVANDVPIKLLVKNLDMIFSGKYRALSTVSKEEARTLMLPAWLDKRIKETPANTIIRPDKTKQIKVKSNKSGQDSPAKMDSYKIPRKKKTLTRNVSESSMSHEENSEKKKATPSERPTTKTLNSPGYKEKDILDVIRIVDKTNTEDWHPYTQ